jgi:hypothetical protein
MSTGEKENTSPSFSRPTVDQRFVIKTPFKERKTGKVTHVSILNFDGHLEFAHQMGLISLTSEIVREWEVMTPAGTNEAGQPIDDITRWVTIKATAVVRGPFGPITATGYNTSQDRDAFVKKPEYLVAVSETRAMKRALYNACGITEALISPNGKEATRESVDLPLHPGEPEDEPSGIPSDVRRPNIHPPLSVDPIHNPPSPPVGGGFGFGDE